MVICLEFLLIILLTCSMNPDTAVTIHLWSFNKVIFVVSQCVFAKPFQLRMITIVVIEIRPHVIRWCNPF